jgi:hypothetical protein
MKLIRLYVDPGEAHEASERLREAGILTKITFEDPHNIKPSKSGAVRVALSVVCDDQFEDAVQLLENPDHVPKRVMSPAEMTEIESGRPSHRFIPGKKSAGLAVLIAFGLCLLGLVILMASG